MCFCAPTLSISIHSPHDMHKSKCCSEIVLIALLTYLFPVCSLVISSHFISVAAMALRVNLTTSQPACSCLTTSAVVTELRIRAPCGCMRLAPACPYCRSRWRRGCWGDL